MAHTPNAGGVWHELVDHLTSVGELAAEFAAPFGASHWARLAGYWHDLGKADPAFRRYLIEADQGRPARSPGIGHSAAGAEHAALAGFELVAFAIAGHHAGLPSVDGLKERLGQSAVDPGSQEARARLGEHPALVSSLDTDAATPSMLAEVQRRDRRLLGELAGRMVFSALVDADRLDTEAHVSVEKARQRDRRGVGIGELLTRFRRRRADVVGIRTGDPVADAREEIRRIVVERAESAAPGLFTLTSPTGSGKTLVALEAALAHAHRHGLRRVVMAAPFISVTEQVADQYRQALDLDGDAVVEHHSNAATGEGNEDRGQGGAALRQRLATENWDMPVIVTTTVQLLESLFSNRPTDCRKLHRLADSVIIIDETQSIPWRLVDSTIHILRQLVEHFGVSVILCTATQPRFMDLPALAGRGLGPVELLGEPERWMPRFSRVTVRTRPEPVGWDDLVDEVVDRAGDEGQALVVLNTVADAEQVAGMLSGVPGLRLLTTRLCPAHRQDVLSKVREDLELPAPVVLVATQLIEAGVDVDFPVGFRAVGPVPSISQVAGRVNRHGRRTSAELVVFDPEDGGVPLGEYKTATSVCRSFVADGRNLLPPATVDEFFRQFLDLQGAELEALGIDVLRGYLNYPEVANRFRMIADDTVGVLVPYGEFDPAEVEPPASPRAARSMLRSLQPFTVSLRRDQYDRAVAEGLTVEVPGLPLARWVGGYDSGLTGLLLASDHHSMSTVL